MSDDNDLVRVASWNVQHNGYAGHRAGANQDRRHLVMDILRSYRPHVVLRGGRLAGPVPGFPGSARTPPPRACCRFYCLC